MRAKQVVLKPQDIVILLKLISWKDQLWKSAEIANALCLSPSEVSESLNRSVYAGLLDPSKKKVYTRSFYDFLINGLKYVYPQKPGPIGRGIPTAHSAAPLSNMINSKDDVYVWPDVDGEVRGQTIVPLYPTVPKAVKSDGYLYELLSLVDAIRVGKARERQIAGEELKERLLVDEK